MVSVLQANLISGFLECILYGIFFIASTASLLLLLRRHRTRHYVPETVGDSVTIFRWKKWIANWWSLRHSPLILATVIFMTTISAVSRLSLFLVERPRADTGVSTAQSLSTD